MTATILLIRHASHGEAGTVLSGRRPGLALSDGGVREAERLALRLAPIPLAALHASPLERTRQTAGAVAAYHPGLAVETHDALLEVDFGAWSGMTFADLAPDPGWQRWNSARAVAETPGGETMAAAQDRAWSHCVRAALGAPGSVLAMVSHCDVIRAVLARVLGLSLDGLLAFEIAPASLSRIEVGEWGARVLALNDTAHLEAA